MESYEFEFDETSLVAIPKTKTYSSNFPLDYDFGL